MKLNTLLFGLALVALTFSCKKDEAEAVVNNYYTNSDGSTSVNMKLLKEYGLRDSTQKLTFSYQNNEKKKLKEMISYSGSVANSRLVINYSGGNATDYQSYDLPASTLQGQGTFKTDAYGNIVETVIRDVSGDTNAIISYNYSKINGEYMLVTRTIFDPVSGQNEDYEYFNYDDRGAMTSWSHYTRSSGTLYKRASYISTPSSHINALPNIMNYIFIVSGSYSNSASLYFSPFMPISTRSETYSSAGVITNTNIQNIDNIIADSDNHVISFDLGSQEIYYKF